MFSFLAEERFAVSPNAGMIPIPLPAKIVEEIHRCKKPS